MHLSGSFSIHQREKLKLAMNSLIFLQKIFGTFEAKKTKLFLIICLVFNFIFE